MSKAIDEFQRLLKEQQKGAVNPQLIWATVEAVDWNAKTMTAKSVVDGLEYYNVLLGLGSFYRKPPIGTKCLLGVLGNKAAATFLIEAEAFEEEIYKSGTTEFTIKETGFIIKQGDESLKTILNDFITEVNKIVVVQGRTIDVAAVTLIKNRLNTVLIG
jgi:hypothetical protein